MSASPSAISVSIDNPEDWNGIAQALADVAGQPGSALPITPEAITNLIGSALPLLYQAGGDDVGTLKGTFDKRAISERVNHDELFQGVSLSSATAHLVGAPPRDDEQPVLRVHLTITGQDAGGQPRVARQFWDIAIAAQEKPSAPQDSCPSCGAPLIQGQLFCSYCGADLRQAASVALTIVKLQLY